MAGWQQARSNPLRLLIPTAARWPLIWVKGKHCAPKVHSINNFLAASGAKVSAQCVDSVLWQAFNQKLATQVPGKFFGQVCQSAGKTSQIVTSTKVKSCFAAHMLAAISLTLAKHK